MLSKPKIFSLIIAVLAAAVFLFLRFALYPQVGKDVKTPPLAEIKKYEAANGLYISSAAARSRPLSVIIENHPDARPQSGLAQADIVYEALAEGGITRFLAIFQSRVADAIGPVRSAREYFAAIADEWGALFAHVGGSNEVIAQLKKGQYKNLADANEYFNFPFFPRREDRPEPHHIFTSTQKLKELIVYHRYADRAAYQPWIFKDDAPFSAATSADKPAVTPLVSQINIDFSRPGYNVSWQYDSVLNSYKRFQSLRPHIDALSGQQISAKTIVAQIVDVTPVPNDPLLQVDIDLTSGGRAIVFQDGIITEGFWTKQAGRTRFYDSSQNEIRFNRGTIWVELVPKDKAVNLEWR